jgi:hypothetical protein
MTDLLEELLDEMEEDEKPEEPDGWEKLTATPHIPEGPGAVERQEDAGGREDRPDPRDEPAGKKAAEPLRQRGSGAALPEGTAAELEQVTAAADRGGDVTGSLARVRRKAAETELAGVRAADSGARGTLTLYRSAARGIRSAQAAAAPAAGAAVTERMTAGTGSLTVDELDRAVRRDSRRYDGGMELY